MKMATKQQIEKIKELQVLQKKQNGMNQYYLTTDYNELTFNQAREVIITLKYFTGTELEFDDIYDENDTLNEVGVIAG